MMRSCSGSGKSPASSTSSRPKCPWECPGVDLLPPSTVYAMCI